MAYGTLASVLLLNRFMSPSRCWAMNSSIILWHMYVDRTNASQVRFYLLVHHCPKNFSQGNMFELTMPVNSHSDLSAVISFCNHGRQEPHDAIAAQILRWRIGPWYQSINALWLIPPPIMPCWPHRFPPLTRVSHANCHPLDTWIVPCAPVGGRYSICPSFGYRRCQPVAWCSHGHAKRSWMCWWWYWYCCAFDASGMSLSVKLDEFFTENSDVAPS